MTIFNCCNNCCEIEVIHYINKRPSRHQRRLTQKAGIFIFDYKSQKVLLVQSRGNLWGIPKGTFEEGAETFVVGRIYLSQKRVAVPMSSVRRHKFL